jgi:hypothetical protein
MTDSPISSSIRLRVLLASLCLSTMAKWLQNGLLVTQGTMLTLSTAALLRPLKISRLLSPLCGVIDRTADTSLCPLNFPVETDEPENPNTDSLSAVVEQAIKGDWT